MKYIFLIHIIILLVFVGFANTRTCKTPSYNQQFETSVLKESNLQTILPQKEIFDSICIPVVVHNIFNLPEQKIDLNTVRAQIEIINKDFNANNSDLAKVDPNFKSLTAKVGFHFFLIDKDLNGNDFNGVNYKQSLVDTFKIAATPETPQTPETPRTYNIKHQSNGVEVWKPNEYINIWVGNLEAGIAGYASYPGLKPTEDGIVIHYQNFGTANNSIKPPFHLGRTLTHELGHYFGLKHLYGETLHSCTEDDGLADTPLTRMSYSGCPKLGNNPNLCNDPYSTQDMVQNFMNQANDACIMMFTNNQKTRMRYHIIENRKGLLHKNCFLEQNTGIDVSLEFDAKPILNCDLSPILPLRICNVGTTKVYSFNIYTNSNIIEEKNVQIVPNQCINYSITTESTIENQVEIVAYIGNVNGLEKDQNLQNNADTVSLISLSKADFPFSENFEDKPLWLSNEAQSNQTTWLHLNETSEQDSDTLNKGCYSLNNSTNQTFSQIQYLHLPYFNLNEIAAQSKNENLNFCIEFDYAYAESEENNPINGMMLEYAQSCTPDNYTMLWENWGADLVTSTTKYTESFLPGSDEWQTVQQSLSFSPDENNMLFRIKFIANSINQVFVDNFSVGMCESIPLNIQNYLTENTFGVFPNPSDGQFNIYSSNPKNRSINVEVFDITGSNIDTFVFQKQYQLNLNAFPSGCYFIKMQYDGHILSKKLILSK